MNHNNLPPQCYATAKAYRVKGGAVVTIIRREGAPRKYRVNARRFRWLRAVFSLASERGWFTNSGFDCALSEPIVEQVEWLKAIGGLPK
jgi:hypothetical protein